MSSDTPTQQSLSSALSDFQVPELGCSLTQAGMLKEVSANGTGWKVSVELPVPSWPNQTQFATEIKQHLIQKIPTAGEIAVEFASNIRGKKTGAKVGLQVKNTIAVGSGKGGVGKSTVAACLAYELKKLGAKVGLLDADVYGPSIPHLVGATGQPQMIEKQNPDGTTIQRLQPIQADGMPMMSLGFMIPEDQAVIWRGPMLHKLLTQFIQQTDWGDLDYLVIDMPPGTGDVAITLSQMVGLAGAVVVCTPQKVALLDAVKAINMYKQVKIPVLGVVENMSGDVFGRGGAKAKAEQLGVPFLGEIGIDAAIRERGDEGKMSALVEDGSPVQEALKTVCQNVTLEVARNVLSAPAMPTLDIL